MKKSKFTLWDLIANIIVGLLFLFILIAAITPDKDKNGNFTQPLKYWTNNTYFEANF